MNKNELKKAALGGLLQNPVFVLVLGTCPTLAMSGTLANAFGLGVATAFVLICSNVFISLLRKVIPDRVRLPGYIVIIATFVTVVELAVAKFFPALNESVGVFIPLIVVNCIILGRAEAYAGKHGALPSLIDGVSMGLGFIAAISLLGLIRQGLTLAGFGVFSQSAGGFIIFGILMALFNLLIDTVKRRNRRQLFRAGTGGKQ
ncbi:MAG: electron transport complex subunit RsxE [Clostridiales bacterium]|jgi:electron transport complex protein RnfE|nr:electron transport complex subunit RsxE [Clostridiales bacterium]